MLQRRARETKDRIYRGLTKVIAGQGISGVTHRSVAEAAQVSLAATTRHFSDKNSMIREFSESVLTDYLTGFEDLLRRVEGGQLPAIRSLDSLAMRASMGGLVFNRIQSIAWCELMLHGGRSQSGRQLAKQWYVEIDRVWTALAGAFGAPPDAARFAVDRVVGNLFLLHPFGLTESQAENVLSEQISISSIAIFEPSSCLLAPLPGLGKGAKKSLDAAIALLVEDGPQSVSFRRVAEQAGLSRSAPAYHFPTVPILLQNAQAALFERAKERYRDGFSAYRGEPMSRGQLADLTAAIVMSEAMQHQAENLAFYSVWLRASSDAAIRSLVGHAFLDQQTAWASALEQIGAPPCRALCMQAVFVGKLIRAISAGVKISELARAREQFFNAMGDVIGTIDQNWK
jgi:AcrR family transcriptional regulator